VLKPHVRPPPLKARPRRFLLPAIVVAAALLLPALAQAITGGAGNGEQVGAGPFDRQGMWIWYVSASNHGSPPSMVSQAKRSGVGTVYVKAADGSSTWSQFNRVLTGRLHHGGLDVCAWQYVYGAHPVAEAKAAAAVISRGADCFVIDAETEYEGRYAAADRYIRALRGRIGADFPVALAGFPYVDYHPAYPYSVFLGPGGAQYNQPQMYWKAIGTSVRAVYEHTYLFNRVWGKPIYPIGQTYENPGRRQLLRFRRFALNYGGQPPSWWSWQETNSGEWSALGSNTGGPVTGYRPITANPVLKRGSKGDLVVWAQMHLIGAGQKQLPVTGIFGKLTYRAVRAFQVANGLTADGVIGSKTWRKLLQVTPYRPNWAGRARHASARMRSAGVSSAEPRAPLSASLPARADELAGKPGP
jgi:hypothetical protein